MATPIKPRRVVVAAGVLSLSLLAPSVVIPAAEQVLPAAVAQTADAFTDRYTTGNFWDAQEAVVEGLTLDPGTQVNPTTNTIFNWNFRNDDGQLVLIRPQSAAAFKTGDVDIRVRVTPAQGSAYTTTLKVNVVDERPKKEWEQQLGTTYTVDFEKSKAPKEIAGLTIPASVTLSKAGITPPPGWVVSADNGKVTVEPPATFTEGYVELPVRVNDGTDSFEVKLKINAKNPQTSTSDITSGIGKTIGSVIGGLIGAPNLGNILGGGSGGNGGSGEGGGGRLVNVVITGNANGNGSPNIIITDNANPRDNLNNNGSNNGSNNSAVITNNANPTVEIKDNGSNNGSNNSAVITGNANPVVTGNANNNGSNNSAVVTGNANPVVTGNANNNGNNNGSNNSAIVTGNANPSVVITGNANPVVTGNANDNGSNNSAIVTGNANPSVVITGNANPVVTGNANDNGNNNGSNNSAIITNNANPSVGGLLGGSSKRDKGGNGGDAGAGAGAGKGGSSNRGGSSIGADVEATGGLTDPRCIASLAGLGLPLLLAIPVALAQGLNTPGLDQLAGQITNTLNDTARNFGVAPEQVTAVAGGLLGATLAVVGGVAIASCIPNVQSVGLTIGGPKTVTETTTPVTVVTTSTEPVASA